MDAAFTAASGPASGTSPSGPAAAGAPPVAAPEAKARTPGAELPLLAGAVLLVALATRRR